MAFDTVIDKVQLENAMKATAEAIRDKTGDDTKIQWKPDVGYAEAIRTLRAEDLIQHADIPAYVKAEAMRVANQVESVRMEDSIVFLAMSDNHHYGEQKDSDQYPDANGIQTDAGNLHAAMAAKILAYGMDFDFMAQLGDATWGSSRTTSAVLQSQVSDVTTMLKEAHKDIPCFHAIGNHDTGIYYHQQMVAEGNTGVYTESGSYLYNRFTALSASETTVFGGEANGGYCYRDFPDKKLRVFLLNTSETLVKDQADKGMLGSQQKWFADALLDLNSKSDAGAWGFLVLSHYPADYGNTMPLSELLKAYVEGGSITISVEDGTSVPVSFANNHAKMIAQFHGHIHNFLAAKLSTRTSNGEAVPYDAWRICIPNAQYARENTYADSNGIILHEDTEYNKTPNSAKDTSFVVNVINPSEEKIYSFCYGAGRNRVIGYGATVYHSIQRTLSNLTISNTTDSVEDGAPYTASLTLNEHCTFTSVMITMGGTDVTSSVYADGQIHIAKVTGHVVITASAKVAYACTNQIPLSTDDSGNIYNGIGYKTKTYINGSGGDAANNATSVTGYIPISFGDVIRMRDMVFSKELANHRIGFYDSNRNWLFNTNANSSYFMDTVFEGVLDSSNNYVQLTINQNANIQGAAYMRICCTNISESSILTVNEEIRYADEVENTYNVVYNLTNSTSSNTAAVVAFGAAYSANISALDGYLLQSVTVTMDSADITSTAYKSGRIHIEKVTGDIVITAVSVIDSMVSYTNQLPISTDASGNIYNGKGYKEDTYLSSGNEGARTGIYTTGFIPIVVDQYGTAKFYCKNVGMTHGEDSHRLCTYNADKTFTGRIWKTTTAGNPFNAYGEDGNISVISIGSTNVPEGGGFIRLCCGYLGADSVITANEEIT